MTRLVEEGFTSTVSDASGPLSQEASREGRLFELVRRSDYAGTTLTDAEIDASLAGTLAEQPPTAIRGTRTFSYGSLIWKPGFDHANRCSVSVCGLRWRFALAPGLGRGTHGYSRLLFGLDCGGSRRGVTSRIENARATEELSPPWRSETTIGSYRPKWVQLNLGRSLGPVPGIAFVGDRSHPNCAPPMSDKALVARVAVAAGLLGSNAEYLSLPAGRLSAAGVTDASRGLPAAAAAASVAGYVDRSWT